MLVPLLLTLHARTFARNFACSCLCSYLCMLVPLLVLLHARTFARNFACSYLCSYLCMLVPLLVTLHAIKLQVLSKTIHELEHSLELESGTAIKWFSGNKMLVNPDYNNKQKTFWVLDGKCQRYH